MSNTSGTALEDFTNVNSISYSSDTVFAIRSDGSLWTWGFYGSGGLGRSDYTNDPNYAVDFAFGWGDAGFTPRAGQVTAMTNGSGLLKVLQAVSDATDPGALKDSLEASAGLALCEDNSVWWWGSIAYGQIYDIGTDGVGLNTWVYYLTNSFSTNWMLPVRQISFDTWTNAPVIQIAGNYGHYMALRKDGTVWEFGLAPSLFSTRGDGYFTNVPVQVSGISNAISIAAGGSYGVALLTNETVWRWGYNGHSPSQWTQPTNMSELANIKKIAANSYLMMALDSSGRVWEWGCDGTGLGISENSDGFFDGDNYVPARIQPCVAKAVDVIPGFESAFAVAG